MSLGDLSTFLTAEMLFEALWVDLAEKTGCLEAFSNSVSELTKIDGASTLGSSEADSMNALLSTSLAAILRSWAEGHHPTPGYSTWGTSCMS